MASLPALESLVNTLVPQSTFNEELRRRLVARCQEILSRHAPSRTNQTITSDTAQLSDQIKQNLLLPAEHVLVPNNASALKFANLYSRLLDQPVLSRKHAALLFLHSLGPSSRPLNSMTQPLSAKIPSSYRGLETQPHGKSKADILKSYRHKGGRVCLPDNLLLRDALYLLQGISGRYIKFIGSEVDHSIQFADEPNHFIPPPTRALVHRLAEVGYLYARVDSFVNERENEVGVGMIEQSLCHHLQAQLTEYYRLIAILESQMATDEKVEVTGNEQELEEHTGLTLRRLDVWINEWRLRMRMMSVCVEGARDAHGGALVNLIHGYTDNGDPFVRKFTDQLLEEVSKPFFVTLHKWLFSGELYDPFSEFFVAADPAMANLNYLHPSSLVGVGQLSGDGGFGGLIADDVSGREDGLRLWEKKYQLQKQMLPAFVGETFGQKIFATGKSLNFIRYSCHDSEWVVTQEKMNTNGGMLRYSDIAGLERLIDTAYQIAGQRLFEIFLDKFKLLDHLSALKNYMLLGRGDFVDQLMEALGSSLSRPANTLYRHNLTATLETAIRSSNAQSDSPDVLRRLDARMLEYSHGEIGWDVFTIEYKVDAPIDTVLNSTSMEKYLKIFKHLWQIKRVEVVLNRGWMRMAGGSRRFLRVPELNLEWHQIRLVVAEMIHFVRQMQAYCHLEVIECSWKTLTEFLAKKEGGLDALIEAHRTYLDKLEKKILLLSPRAGKEENVLHLVREVFTIIIQFREATDNFYNYCLSESSRRDQLLDGARGVHTGSDFNSANSAEALHSILRRLKEYGALFTEKTQSIVIHLQAHHDLDCRFLGIRLSFSDYYKIRKDQHK
ncbi:gamma-tubulin complex DGRIP91/SPC98 component [Amanita rubescens]|nr:gamma-tubulin complex DGRIP91/SPC98 component [Amanita rubescens]